MFTVSSLITFYLNNVLFLFILSTNDNEDQQTKSDFSAKLLKMHNFPVCKQLFGKSV